MITEGYLARHYRGRRGGRDPALLDIAQDYALKIIQDAGLFDLGLTFKGGTALRKYRVGASGRFSTDLDFAGEEGGLGELLFEALDGAVLHEVRFAIGVVTAGRRAKLRVETPIGNPRIDARIEVSPRAPWLTPEWVQPVPFPVHRGYEFVPVSLPVMVLEEILAPRRDSDFPPENLGVLTGEVDISLWLDKVHARFGFLVQPTEEESQWARCDPRDAREVGLVIESLRDSTSVS